MRVGEDVADVERPGNGGRRGIDDKGFVTAAGGVVLIDASLVPFGVPGIFGLLRLEVFWKLGDVHDLRVVGAGAEGAGYPSIVAEKKSAGVGRGPRPNFT